MYTTERSFCINTSDKMSLRISKNVKCEKNKYLEQFFLAFIKIFYARKYSNAIFNITILRRKTGRPRNKIRKAKAFRGIIRVVKCTNCQNFKQLARNPCLIERRIGRI